MLLQQIRVIPFFSKLNSGVKLGCLWENIYPENITVEIQKVGLINIQYFVSLVDFVPFHSIRMAGLENMSTVCAVYWRQVTEWNKYVILGFGNIFRRRKRKRASVWLCLVLLIICCSWHQCQLSDSVSAYELLHVDRKSNQESKQ